MRFVLASPTNSKAGAPLFSEKMPNVPAIGQPKVHSVCKTSANDPAVERCAQRVQEANTNREQVIDVQNHLMNISASSLRRTETRTARNPNKSKHKIYEKASSSHHLQPHGFAMYTYAGTRHSPTDS